MRAAAEAEDPLARVEDLKIGIGALLASVTRILDDEPPSLPTGVTTWSPPALVHVLVGQIGSTAGKDSLRVRNERVDELVRAAAEAEDPLAALGALSLKRYELESSLKRISPPARFNCRSSTKSISEQLIVACSVGAEASVGDHVRVRLENNMPIWTLADAVESIVTRSGIEAEAVYDALCAGGLMGPDTRNSVSLSTVRNALRQGAEGKRGSRRRYVRDGKLYRLIG